MSRKSKIDPMSKVSLVEQYLRNEINISEASRVAGISRESFKDWVSIYRNEGPVGLLDQIL